jgi:hypothetical protein
LFLLTLVTSVPMVVTARADDLKLREKFQLAEVFEGAAFAAERCPGLHVAEDAVTVTADELGVTDDDIYSPQWKFWEARGQTNARIGYEKDPTGWCESIWLGNASSEIGEDRPLFSRQLYQRGINAIL